MREGTTHTKENTLRDFTVVVFRRKGVILAVFLATVVTVIALNIAEPPIYLSTSRILLSRGEPESVFNTNLKLLPWDEEVNSEIEVIQSPTFGERAQKVLNTQKAVDSRGQPIKFNSLNVSVTPSGKASVLILTYSAPDALEAREALRALTHAYMEWRTNERSLPVVEGFFQEELESLRDQLSQWEQRRADFMGEEGVVSITGERESLLRQKESSLLQLGQARTRLAEYAAKLEEVRNLQQEKRLDSNVEIFGLGDADYNDEELLLNLRKELLLSRSAYYQKKGRYTDTHPDVRAAKEVVDNLEAQLDIETDNYVRFLEARIAVSRARVNSLEATVRGIDDELSGLPDKEARLAQYDRIIAALDTDYSTMVEKQIAAKLENTGRMTWRVFLLQPAAPAESERTRDYVRAALAPLFALLIGLALAFIIDGLDHSIKDATEAEAHLGVPVLGSLSRIR